MVVFSPPFLTLLCFSPIFFCPVYCLWLFLSAVFLSQVLQVLLDFLLYVCSNSHFHTVCFLLVHYMCYGILCCNYVPKHLQFLICPHLRRLICICVTEVVFRCHANTYFHLCVVIHLHVLAARQHKGLSGYWTLFSQFLMNWTFKYVWWQESDPSHRWDWTCWTCHPNYCSTRKKGRRRMDFCGLQRCWFEVCCVHNSTGQISSRVTTQAS